MRRRLRHTHPLTIAGIALAAGCALAAANLYLALDADDVSGWIGARVSAALARPVTVGEARLSLLPRPSVRIADVRVGNPPAFGGPSLAHAEMLRFDVAWLPLVVGRVRVRRLVADGVHLHLAVDEQGATNFGDFVPGRLAAAGDSLPNALSLRVREVTVRSGSLSYFDAQAGRSAMVAGARGDASLSPDEEGGWRAGVSARSDSLLVRFAGKDERIFRGPGPTASLVARGVDAPGEVRIEDGVLTLAGDTLGLRGELSLRGPDPTFDLRLGNNALPADFLSALFTADSRSRLLPRVEGRLGVSLHLTRGAGERASLRGGFMLDDVALRIRGEALAEHLRGVVSLSRDSLALDSLTGVFAGGPFELSGTIDRIDRVMALVGHLEPDLATFGRLGLLPPGMELSGGMWMQASFVGPLDAPDSLEVVGSAAFQGLRLEHARLGVPIYFPVGELAFLGSEASWSELTALVGEDRLTTSGSLRRLGDAWPGGGRTPQVDVSITAQHLDLGAALPARQSPSPASYAQLALAHLGGRSVDGRAAAALAADRRMSRPDRLPVHGTVAIDVDTLRYRRYSLGSVVARLELTDSAFSVTEADFEAWGGRATGSLLLGVGEGSEAPFSLVLALAEVEGEPFLSAMSPLGSAVSGALDLDLEVEGWTDASLLPMRESLTGRMGIELEEGRFAGTGINLALADFLGSEDWEDLSFTRWSLDVRIADGALDIREGSFMGEPGVVVFGGPLHFDGSADLSMAVTIPSDHLDRVSLRRTGIGQGVLDQLRSAGGSLDLGLRLSGWIQAPTLEPDASNTLALSPRSP